MAQLIRCDGCGRELHPEYETRFHIERRGIFMQFASMSEEPADLCSLPCIEKWVEKRHQAEAEVSRRLYTT